MDVFVKRNDYRKFEKAKIEIEDVMELVIIQSGIEKELERVAEMIYLCEKVQRDTGEDYSKDIESYLESKGKLEKMLKALKQENELVWQ